MLFYNKLRGGTGVVDGLYPTTTIKELQKKIFKKEHVPGDPSTRCITFWLGRKELRYDDDRTVADYAMVKDDSILLTLPSSKSSHRHDSRRPCHEVSFCANVMLLRQFCTMSLFIFSCFWQKV